MTPNEYFRIRYLQRFRVLIAWKFFKGCGEYDRVTAQKIIDWIEDKTNEHGNDYWQSCAGTANQGTV